jgi:hypothetical protein
MLRKNFYCVRINEVKNTAGQITRLKKSGTILIFKLLMHDLRKVQNFKFNILNKLWMHVVYLYWVKQKE